jgi:hypothetical protein
MKLKSIRTGIRVASAVLVVAVFATSCATSVTDMSYSDVELNRRIVDANTGHAIPNAIVVFKWNQSEGDIGHGSRTFCVRVEMRHADVDGRYSVPSWEGRKPMIAVIYKRSYSRVNDPAARARGIDKMERHIGSGSERLVELERIYAPLNCPKSEDIKLVELYEAMYNEAKAIAQTSKDAQAVEGALRILEVAKHGEAEASSRARERLQKRATEGR